MARSPYLFAYGTLMRGLRLHRYLGDAAFLGRASLVGRLLELGGYPGWVPDVRGGGRVWGELYRLNDPERDLPRLDRLEGYCRDDPRSPFVRECRPVRLEGGRRVRAWVYRYAGPRGAGCPIGGDYRAHLR